MTNMWDAATIDYEQERLDGYVTAAFVAVAEQHGFVLSASTKQEFDDRLAMMAHAVESAVERVTYGDPASFPIVHQAVLASWERDFDIVAEARQVEAQRKNARRAFFRRQAAYRYVMIDTKDGSRAGNFSTLESALSKVEDSEKNWGAPKGRYRIKDRETGKFVDPLTAAGSRKVAWTEDESDVTPMAKKRSKRESSLTAFGALSCPTCKADVSTGAKIFDHGDQQVLRAKCDSCGWSGSKRKPKKTSGFKVVDDQSGASNGTVYPNKEIADQADYGEGYSVQYTEDTPKSASWTKQANLWISHTGSRVMEVAEIDGRFVWGSYRLADDSVIAEGSAATLELAKQAAYLGGYLVFSLGDSKLELNIITWAQADGIKPETGFFPLLGTFPNDHAPRYYGKMTGRTTQKWDMACPTVELYEVDTIADEAGVIWGVRGKRVPGMWAVRPEAADQIRSVTASKTAGENPFAKKDDDKAAAPKDDKTDSDSDGEQDGPLQAGEKAEPKGDDQAAPAAEAPADQQAAPADPNAPAADPSVDGSGQDKGLAQDPASTSDAVDQQPADPTVMDVGQSTSMGFTMVEGGNGSIEVTFVREENGVYFFNGPTGEFGVGQMNGQWQDADGNTFTFGGAPAAPQGIGPAQDQAAAADVATPVPTPDANAGAAPQAAQPAAAPPVAPPAKDETANPAEDPAPAPAADKPAEPAKDDGDKKENPFAKKSSSYPSSFGNQGYEHVRSLMELSGVPVRDWSDKELLANLGRGDVQSEARSRNIWG